MRIAVTRPEEDAGPLVGKLEAAGHAAIAVPLLVIAPRPATAIDDASWQAVVATSANGIRALAGHDELKTLRMLTVGPQSLKAAAAAGFVQAEAHGGDVDGLARHIRERLAPHGGPILYLSGAETAGDLQGQLAAAGFDCRRVVLYDAVPATGLGQAEAPLRDGRLDAVLLYSPRSARIWCDLVARAGLVAEAAAPHYLCLSANVAKLLPPAWKRHIAAAPEESAMLALLEELRGTR